MGGVKDGLYFLCPFAGGFAFSGISRTGNEHLGAARKIAWSVVVRTVNDPLESTQVDCRFHMVLRQIEAMSRNFHR
jgi:hypothetical protein